MVGCIWECSLRKLEIKERSWLSAEDPCCISPLTVSHQACGLWFEAHCLYFLSEHLCLKKKNKPKGRTVFPSQTFSVSCSSVLGLANFLENFNGSSWCQEMLQLEWTVQSPCIQLTQTGKDWSELLQPLPVIGCCCVSRGLVCPFHVGSEGHSALITSSAS